MADKKYDIVIFGATGFTGKHVVEELSKTLDNEGNKSTWAIAGRSKQKLQAVLEEVSKVTCKNLKDIPTIEADVSSPQSLDAMCKQAKLLLNCVGPYRFYGEPVVKACVENNCHHLDVSGEPQFLEQIQIDYHKKAFDAGIYVIGAAGFDSIPCELGIQYLQSKSEGDVNSIETFMKVRSGSEGSRFNVGTWLSAIHGFAHGKELGPLRKKLFENPMPRSSHKLKPRGVLFYENDVKKWCVPFPVTDKSVVTRTAYYNYHNRNMRPVQMLSYLCLPSFFSGIMTIMFGVFFGLMATFSPTRKLLEKYPYVFSFGMFSNEGPSRKQMEETTFEMVLIANSYSSKLNNLQEQHSEAPSKKLIASVKGPEPGYVATPIFLIQCALTVLQETNKLPKGGGVYTPGSALLNTTLMDRVQKYGIEILLK